MRGTGERAAGASASYSGRRRSGGAAGQAVAVAGSRTAGASPGPSGLVETVATIAIARRRALALSNGDGVWRGR